MLLFETKGLAGLAGVFCGLGAWPGVTAPGWVARLLIALFALASAHVGAVKHGKSHCACLGLMSLFVPQQQLYFADGYTVNVGNSCHSTRNSGTWIV